jgi:hypothetical protein
MKKLTTIALAVIFVVSLSGMAMAERTTLAIGGGIDVMGIYQENISVAGASGNNNFVDMLIELDVAADLTDNISAVLGLEATGAMGGQGLFPVYDVDGQAAALAVEEAYIKAAEVIRPELTLTVGVQNIAYSLRGDGNEMFLSIPEVGAIKGTLDYDPLYVDIIIAKLNETGYDGIAGVSLNDTDLYAIVVEYYMENDSKVQVILHNTNNESGNTSWTEYSLGVDYKAIENLELFLQIGGQSGEAGNVDISEFAFNIGAEYTFADVTRTPYVGLSYQSFGGDDTDLNWRAGYKDIDETLIAEADADLRDHNVNGTKLLTTNYSAIRIVAGCEIDEKTSLDGEIAIFTRVEDGTASDALAINADDSIGTEIDLGVTHQYTDDLEVGLAVAYLAPGDGIEDTSGDDEAMIGMYATASLDF